MYQVIIVIQVLVGLGIIGLVLMQHGKGADAGAAFGSGASGSVFGAQGSASFLSRATAILAVVFFASSLGLAILSGYTEKSTDIMDMEEDTLADMPLVGADPASPGEGDMPSDLPSDEVPVMDPSGEIPVQPISETVIPDQGVVEQVIEESVQVTEQIQDKAGDLQEQSQVAIPE